jgi:hypothetical protein
MDQDAHPTQPAIPEAVLLAITAAPWRATNHVQPHEYIVSHQARDLYQAMGQLLAEHGYDQPFQGRTYRYLYIGAYKYWRIPPILNRERLPEADPLTDERTSHG